MSVTKIYKICIVYGSLFPILTHAIAQSNNSIPVEKILNLATSQYQSYINQQRDSNLHLYSIDENNNVKSVTYKDWTSGFFAGALWYLYRFTKNKKWGDYAKELTATLAPAQWLTNKHDLGFILYTSFGNGFNLIHDSAYKNILLQGAKTLSNRFDPLVGSIRSWDNGPWHYPVIVDNLMNLELLFWAAKNSHNSSFSHMAVSHLNNDLAHRFRKDGSTYHVLDFDPASGKFLAGKTWQGYSDSSCWARGQAWAIYGLTMSYRYTHNEKYLRYAIKAANYFIDQIRKTADYIPYWDFNDPSIPNAPKDASAAAIAASGLMELSHYQSDPKSLYYNTAVKILQSLCTSEYLAAPGSNYYFLLKHSVINKHAGKGVDVPVIYADYYFLQALWRYKNYDVVSD